MSELDSKNKARKHLDRVGVCGKLKALVKMVILEGGVDMKVSIDQLEYALKRVVFKTYTFDLKSAMKIWDSLITD